MAYSNITAAPHEYFYQKGLVFARLIAAQDHYHHRLLVHIQSRYTPVTRFHAFLHHGGGGGRLNSIVTLAGYVPCLLQISVPNYRFLLASSGQTLPRNGFQCCTGLWATGAAAAIFIRFGVPKGHT